MATIPVANARIDALDNKHWVPGATYEPQDSPFPFADIPASHRDGAKARASARRAKRLQVCATCFVASCDEH